MYLQNGLLINYLCNVNGTYPWKESCEVFFNEFFLKKFYLQINRYILIMLFYLNFETISYPLKIICY